MDEDGAVAQLPRTGLPLSTSAPQVTGHDLLLDREVTWNLGFQIDDADLGMGGAGGSSVVLLRGAYAAAYVTRGLGTHDRGDAVYALLEERYG